MRRGAMVGRVSSEASRRTFLAAATGAVLTAPLSVLAQPTGKIYVIGYLGSTSPSGAHGKLVEAFRNGLSDLGYVEGRDVTIEYRWAEGKYDRLPELAADLVRLPVDLIVTHGTPGSRAAKLATSTIPIVMAVSGDAVATGLVASIARPGGNLTGSTFFFPELMAKRLELLKEALPRATRITAFANADNLAATSALHAMELRGRSLGVAIDAVRVRRPDELAGAFSAIGRARTDGVVLIDDPMLIANARQIAGLAVKNRIPVIGDWDYADAGGLMAYAVNFQEFWRQAAVFVDKIFKGAKPGDLPVEQATRFDLVINRGAATALALTIPQSLLLRATHVVE
jgi:putative ABC transport system substrate-binding protein